MYYALVGRDLEHEIVPICRDAGIAVMVWSPLAGGFQLIDLLPSIAAVRGASAAQIAWRGCSPVRQCHPFW